MEINLNDVNGLLNEEQQVPPTEEYKGHMAQRFQNMNIPLPIPKNQISASVANGGSEKFKKIEQIRRGLAKQDMSKFIQKEGTSKKVHTDIPVNKPKGNGLQGGEKITNHVPLAGFDAAPVAEASMLESMFNVGPSTKTIVNNREQLQLEQVSPDDTGRAFTESMRLKFNSSMNAKGVQGSMPPPAPANHNQNFNPNQNLNQGFPTQNPVHGYPVIPSGSIVMNEEDLKKKIISISKLVAEQMIKKVLAEYSKLQESRDIKTVAKPAAKPVIAASAPNPNTVEVVGEGLIKVNDVYYKKVQVKKVNE